MAKTSDCIYLPKYCDLINVWITDLGNWRNLVSILLSHKWESRGWRKEVPFLVWFCQGSGKKGKEAEAVPCPVLPMFLGCCFWISPGKMLLRLILLPDKMGGEISSVFQWTWVVSSSCSDVEHLILFWLCLSTIIEIVVANAQPLFDRWMRINCHVRTLPCSSGY